jgi:hypothetical protein
VKKSRFFYSAFPVTQKRDFEPQKLNPSPGKSNRKKSLRERGYVAEWGCKSVSADLRSIQSVRDAFFAFAERCERQGCEFGLRDPDFTSSERIVLHFYRERAVPQTSRFISAKPTAPIPTSDIYHKANNLSPENQGRVDLITVTILWSFEENE